MGSIKKKQGFGPFIFIAGSVFFIINIFFSLFYSYAINPIDPGNEEKTVTIEIPKGSSFTAVEALLKQSELIKQERLFYLLAFFKGAPKHIRAGEYELDGSMSPEEVLDKLLQGKIKGYRIPIPEGFTIDQIADRLAEWKLVDRNKFLHLARDRNFLKALYIPGETAEGYLFPDTYIFTRSMGEAEHIMFMVRHFRHMLKPEMMERAAELGFNVEEMITLASIIEKEGGLEEEKPLIAAVFHNRLKRGMRLQSDPTVIYGIKDFNGNLTRKDLRKITPYNTYRIKGLPPGPICNPGLTSILAALYPAPVDYLFFVSKNDGSHHFSSGLADHNKAVIKYQIKRRR